MRVWNSLWKGWRNKWRDVLREYNGYRGMCYGYEGVEIWG